MDRREEDEILLAMTKAAGEKWLQDAFERGQDKIIAGIEEEATKSYEESPLVSAPEACPAGTILFVKAIKDDFRTVTFKKSGDTRLIFDARLLAGKISIKRVKKDGTKLPIIDITTGDAMSIMLGDPQNPSPSKLHKLLKKMRPFENKDLCIANLGKKKYKARTYWDFYVVPAEQARKIAEK